MAIQDEDFQKRLNEALGMFGQAPTDMPVQTVDPVRAERLAFEASQAAPVASIAPTASVAPPASVAPDNDPRLQAMIANQNALRENLLAQQAQAAKTAEAVGKRPNQRFLKEGQGFMDAFKNPGEGQRAFAIKAGLSLLSSGGTQDLSQRIGHALGAGVQGMQGARQAEIDSAAKVAQAQQARLTGEAGIIKQDMSFGDQRAAYKANQLAAAAAVDQKNYNRTRDALSQGNVEEAREIAKTNLIAKTVRDDRVREENRVIAAKNKQDTLLQQAATQQGIQDRFAITELRLGEEKPSAQLKTINEIATLRENGETDKANLLQAYYNKQTALSSTVRTVDPNTGEIRFETSSKIPKYTGGVGETPISLKKLAEGLSSGDAKLINAEREKFLASSQGDLSMGQFESLLDNGLKTGGAFTSGVAALESGAVDLMQAAGIGLPFYSDEEELQLADQVGMREAAIALSSQMGAERLEMFGGNDSERELLVALAMAPGVDKSIAGNRRIIKNNKIASQVLRSRLDFMENWVSENQGYSRVNKEGQNFASAWSKYQVSQFRKLGGDLSSEDIDEASRKAGQSAVNVYRSKMGFDSGLSTDAYGNAPSAVESATGNPVLKSVAQDIINKYKTGN
tara:strand:- start:3959 stop:5833 length:1875 start_codon:yes stop_codon:yes gene_type:complete